MSSISSNNNLSSINKLDSNKDSKITLKELKEVAKKDGNEGDLSVKDLESVGIKDKNIQKEIISKYNKSVEFDPNKTVFELKNNKTQEGPKNKKDGDWQDAIKFQKDPGNDIKAAIKNKTVDKMKADLLKKTDNNDLVKFMLLNIDKLPNDTMKKEAVHYISKLFDKHPNKANEILKDLYMYAGSNAPEGALVGNSQKMEFVKDILHDITYPTDIDQREKGTCAATAVQAKLAITNPKKYVDIATKLGDGKSWNGISPNKTYQNETNADNRSLSCKIIQNAFMDYANGGTKYDSTKYQNGKKVDSTGAGLTGGESEKLEEKIFGNTDIDDVQPNLFVSKEELLTELDKTLKKTPVSFSVDGHAMLVLSKNNDGSYNIFTWGEERKISAEDMKKHIIGARVIDDSSWNSY